MGRPCKPLADKIRDGTLRMDRVNLGEPQPSPFDTTNPFDPETNLHAWRQWEMIVPELTDRYSVGLGDRNEVYQYCWYYDRAMRAAEEYAGIMTTVNDMGDLKVHPLVKVEDASWDRVSRIGAKLGLNPVDRRKIRAKSGPQGVLDGIPGVLPITAYARDRSRGPAQIEETEEPPEAG